MRIASRRIGLAAVLGLLVAAGTVHAGLTTNLTLYPNASPNVIGSSNAAPGFPSGSWQADATTPLAKSEVYITPATLFGPNEPAVTIGDIKSISYWTNKPGDGGAVDWTLLIYTNTTGNGDTGSFYHTRLNAEPYFTQSTVSPNTWHQWSTNDPTNPLKFYDQARDGNQGTYNDPTLAGIQANTTQNYSAETVKYFSLQTGSAWANGFTGLVDGLTITLTNGDVANVNLEAVATPEPSTIISASMAGLIGLGYGWRRRKAKATA